MIVIMKFEFFFVENINWNAGVQHQINDSNLTIWIA